MKTEQKIIKLNYLESLRLYYYLTGLCARSDKEVEEVGIKRAMVGNIIERMKINSGGVISPAIKHCEEQFARLDGFHKMMVHGNKTLKELKAFNASGILFLFDIIPDGNSGEHQLIMEIVERYLICPPLNTLFEEADIKTQPDVIPQIG